MKCEDINECYSGAHTCLESQRCDNTLGSFTCVRYTTCGTGYTLNYDSGRCEDDDECAIGTHNCDQLGAGYLCLNIQGSFRCEKRRCNLGEILGEDGLCAPLRCQAGFEPGRSGSCVDVDECKTGQVCPPGRRCVNTMGSFECVSRCEIGLQLDPATNSCSDVDECLTGRASCFGGRRCVNTVGSYRCSCPDGYKENGGGACVDIDECKDTRTNRCGIDSECQNSQGSFRCVCKPGFKLQPGLASSSSSSLTSAKEKELSSRREGRVTSLTSLGTCMDIDECKEIPGICQQRCTNLWGSYRCHCRPGFRLSSDSRTCIDVDECRDYEGLCIGNCVNEPGSYRCSCPSGYTLSSNGRTCQDIDECLESHPCRGGPDQHCFNTRGGYKCKFIGCEEGYEKEAGHERRCRRRTTRCRATDISCIRKPVSVSHNFIALISNLRVHGRGVNLFTMQSAKYRMLTTKFTLSVREIRAPGNVPKAGREYFRLKTGSHSAVLSLVKPIQGPQDITLELLMEMYHMGKFQASAAANIYIYVTPHEF